MPDRAIWAARRGILLRDIPRRGIPPRATHHRPWRGRLIIPLRGILRRIILRRRCRITPRRIFQPRITPLPRRIFLCREAAAGGRESLDGRSQIF